MLTALGRLASWWMDDPDAPVVSERVRRVVWLVALGIGAGAGWEVTAALRTAPKPPPVSAATLSEAQRRAIFAGIAASEPSWREQAHQHFPEAWSAEDDRAAFERDRVRQLARDNGVNVSDVYLVLDEGIRAHWLGPDGKPLDAATVPLKPRR